MSLHYFINTEGTRRDTSRLFEFYGKTLDVDTAYIDEKLEVTNKDKDEKLDFVYDSKKTPGSFFINKDGEKCDFETKNGLFPELQNIVKEETIENETRISGKLIVENFVLADGTDLKTYIDDRIQFILNSIGGTVTTLTAPTIQEEEIP